MLNADKKGNKNWTAQTGQYVLSSAHIEHKLCLSVRKHEDSGQNTQFHHRAGHDHASWSRLHLSLQPALALSLWPAGPHGHLQCCRLCGAAIFLPEQSLSNIDIAQTRNQLLIQKSCFYAGFAASHQRFQDLSRKSRRQRFNPRPDNKGCVPSSGLANKSRCPNRRGSENTNQAPVSSSTEK